MPCSKPNRFHQRAYRPGSALCARKSPPRRIGVMSPQQARSRRFPKRSYEQRGARIKQAEQSSTGVAARPPVRQKQGAGPPAYTGTGEETAPRSPARALAQMRAPECRSATRLLRTKSGSACSPKNAVSSRRDEDAPGSLASRSSKAYQSGPWSATPPTPRNQRLRRPRPDLETSGSR